MVSNCTELSRISICQFEDRIAATITQTKDIPGLIADTGAITVTVPKLGYINH
jgi:hypothetical protein